MKIVMMRTDELNTEVSCGEIKILSLDSLSREEKSDYAKYLIAQAKERYPEAHRFWFEKVETTYRDWDATWDFFYEIATEEDGMSDEEAEQFVNEAVEKEKAEYYDLGFDY